jgi:transposase
MARKRVINIRHPELTEEQGELLACVLPEPQPSPRGGPKPVPNRPVVEGILWVLRNGGRGKALPDGYPSPCGRRRAEGEEQGIWREARRTFRDTLHEQDRLDGEECFTDGSFAPAKKGAMGLGKPSGARGRSGWWWLLVKEFRWRATSTRPARRR